MSTHSPFGTFTRFFFTFGVIPLLFIAGVQLFVLPGQTETTFAWTIPLPLTAAFMGAGYWAALAHVFLIARNPGWERTRVSIPAAFTATALLLIATLLHLGQFHLDSPAFITRFVTWVWIIVYVVTPPIFLYFLVTRFWKAGNKVASRNPFPGWARGGLALLAAFGLITGFGLFFFPESLSPFWPWALAPLAARAVGAWMSTFGVVAATLAWENDTASGKGALASLLAFCVLQLVVILRYPASLDFAKPLAWGYILFLLIGLVVSALGLLKKN